MAASVTFLASVGVREFSVNLPRWAGGQTLGISHDTSEN